MFTFGIGIFSFIGALLFLVFYFGNIGTRKIVAWVKNEDTMIKEKVWFISILMIILGFFFGSWVQGYWDDITPCVSYLGDVAKCIFDFRQHKNY